MLLLPRFFNISEAPFLKADSVAFLLSSANFPVDSSFTVLRSPTSEALKNLSIVFRIASSALDTVTLATFVEEREATVCLVVEQEISVRSIMGRKIIFLNLHISLLSVWKFGGKEKSHPWN